MSDIVYATTNPGKFTEVSNLFKNYGIKIKSVRDYSVNIEVDETGSTLEENAILKAESYLAAIKNDVVVVGDDTGLEIDALNGEPGIKVRRWKGYKMTDEEIIDYTLERLKNVPDKLRTAQFRTVIAVAQKDQKTLTFSGSLKGKILIKPNKYREAGLPFQPLFYSTDFKLRLYQIHQLSSEVRLSKNITTHRERAVIAAIPYLSTLLSQNQT